MVDHGPATTVQLNEIGCCALRCIREDFLGAAQPLGWPVAISGDCEEGRLARGYHVGPRPTTGGRLHAYEEEGTPGDECKHVRCQKQRSPKGPGSQEDQLLVPSVQVGTGTHMLRREPTGSNKKSGDRY